MVEPRATDRRPYLVAHVAVALHGPSTGFAADVRRFYELVDTWHEDVTLTGAETVLAQEAALRTAPCSLSSTAEAE